MVAQYHTFLHSLTLFSILLCTLSHCSLYYSALAHTVPHSSATVPTQDHTKYALYTYIGSHVAAGPV